MNRLGLLLLVAVGACDVRVRRAGSDSMRPDSAARTGTTASARRVPDTRRSPPRVVRHDVIARGTHGIAARVRWLLSPDKLSLVFVEDPAAVEADPLPDGVIYASEQRSALVQIEDVWDATPSPDWRWLAYGRAFILRGEYRDTIAAKRWVTLAQLFAELQVRRGVDPNRAAQYRRDVERDLREHSFPVSGMSIMYGTASVGLLRLDSLPAGARQLTDTVLPTHLGGWRVRWTRNDTLGVGQRPARTRDEAPASQWDLVLPLGTDSASATITVASDTTRFVPMDWSIGPTLDISSAIDPGTAKVIDAGAARIESRGGSIYLTRPGDATPIPIGPGVALAATANGRYIAAIAPRTERRGNETPTVAAVYEVVPQ